MNDLTDLLHDAVSDIEPTERLGEIRARAAAAPRPVWPWLLVGGGGLVAAAAAVAAFALTQHAGTGDGPGPATGPDEQRDSVTVAAYYLGEGAGGPRLFRELDPALATSRLDAALDRLQAPPLDPDYRTPWPQGSLESARLTGDTIEVELGDAAAGVSAGLGEGLPAQALVYTLQAAAGQTLPVQLFRDGEPVGDPIQRRAENDVLNPVSISEPAEGTAYHGSFTARGRANSFEGTVRWELRDERGRIVRHGFTTASGSMDRLYPWRVRFSLAGVPYGFYTFVAATDDPSGGAEGAGSKPDTRTVIVR